MTRKLAGSLLAFMLGWSCAVARADDAPSWFVPADKCMSRKCTCDDMPMIEVFLQNQKDARDAWMTVKSDILAGSGPASGPDAIKLFQSRFPGDSRVTDRFKSCSTYKDTRNSVNKVAGVTPGGAASLDPCFCETFCQDIIDSTIAHERMHVPTIILGVLGQADMRIGCALGIGPAKLCSALDPLVIANSELASYATGIQTLDAAAMRIPNESDVECTWEPLPEPADAMQTRLERPAPSGFFARLQLIVERILRGAMPTEEQTAMLDAPRR